MPQIPMSNRAGLIRHQQTTVAASGAPGAGWKTEDGAAMARLGDTLADAGARVGSSMMEFARRSMEAENELAAAEADNVFYEEYDKLDERMSANPGAYHEYKNWATETDRNIVERQREALKRMSPGGRERYELRLAGLRERAAAERSKIGAAAVARAQRDEFQRLYFDKAKSGDGEGAAALLSGVNGTLFAPEEREELERQWLEVRDGTAAKRLIDSGADDAVDRLAAKGEDGSFREFVGMAPEYRDQLLRAAKANDAIRRSEENQQLVDRLNNGELMTPEAIEKAFEGKTSAGSIRQKNQQKQIVKSFFRERQAERERLAKEEQREQREAREEKRRQQAEAVDAREFRLLDYRFSDDPARRKEEYAELRNGILTDCAGDGPTAKRLIRQLDETLKAKENPESSYKNTFAYIYGSRLLDGMQGSFYSRYPGRGDSWYSFATNVYNDDKTLKADNFAMAKLQFDAFMKTNPQATTQEIETFLEKLKKDVNWAECDKLIEFWAGYLPYRVDSAPLSSGENERMVNGRTAIFGSDKKFIRWKDGR